MQGTDFPPTRLKMCGRRRSGRPAAALTDDGREVQFAFRGRTPGVSPLIRRGRPLPEQGPKCSAERPFLLTSQPFRRCRTLHDISAGQIAPQGGNYDGIAIREERNDGFLCSL